jgi:hypothetical protein
MLNTVSHGVNESASNQLSDTQQLINDSINKLDSELRDINHKVSQYG